MKIAVNTRLLRKNEMDGIGWFAYNTLRHIVTQNRNVEFHFLFDSGVDPSFLFSDNIVPHNLFPPAKHALLNLVWFEVSAKRFLNKLSPDLFLSPDGILCLGWQGRQYGVIHDINFYHNPADLKWSNRTYYNYFFPKYANKATRLGTVSEYSKEDMVQHYGIQPSKIDVVYNGVNTFFTPVSGQEQQKTKQTFSGGRDYFVFVGTLHPRKNIIRLLQAFDLFKQQTGAPVQLVIAGKNLYKTDEIYQQHRQMQFGRDVVFAGRVSDDQLNALIGSALALTFVPTFEGFGIPIIEAMQCDVPVLCANTTSMPEVAGDAALLVDPFNIEAIKEGMVRMYRDADLRQSLIQKGRVRKDVFTWERSASLLWQGIQKCL